MPRLPATNILDFDIETRPLTFMGGGFTTDEITSIACSFVGEDNVNVFQMGWFDYKDEATFHHAYRIMLLAFVEHYKRADIVTGHYIRAFDLPKINGALLEAGMGSLDVKMTCDTKMDLIRFSGISKSQENLGAMLSYFDQSNPYLGRKEHMSQVEWRTANRFTAEGLEESRRRVAGDVLQHKEMRLALLEAGFLRGPKAWRP